MSNPEYAKRIEEVKRRAHGRWTEILASLGVDERILQRRNLPCPLCGGTDRFQYTDKFGEGNYHCRQCGAGGGFKLLQAITGVDFATALREVERSLGMMTVAAPVRTSEPSAERMKKLAQRIWNEAQPVTAGDQVDRYLASRGLALPYYPRVLRFHPALGYYRKDADGKSRKLAEYPAMLACIQGADGHGVTLHRTYLQDGAKLAAEDAKKVLSAGINGAAVRLFEATEELAIAEGIETALAVHLATGKPVWAALSAGNLERLWLPDSVRRLCLYADTTRTATSPAKPMPMPSLAGSCVKKRGPVRASCRSSCRGRPAPTGPRCGSNGRLLACRARRECYSSGAAHPGDGTAPAFSAAVPIPAPPPKRPSFPW